MKNIFKKTLDTLKYLPVVATALLAQEIKGQDIWARPWPLPEEPINLFISQGTTSQTLEYNALKTKVERDIILPEKVKSDISGKIVGPTWTCSRGPPLFVHNSREWGKGIYEFGAGLLYDGYDGENLDSIMLHEGTTKFVGTLGLPSGLVEIPNVSHGMTYVLTGDNIKKGEDYNFMEIMYPFNQTDVKPGQIYLPMNSDMVMIYYSYLYKNTAHEKNLAIVPVVWLKIVNGKWEFVATNPNVKIITDRESDPPNLKVENTGNPNVLKATATDANLKGIYYSVDGGEKKPLTSGLEINMGLPDGTHTIKVSADDYFRLVSDTTFQRTITTPANNPPIITFIAPENGKLYDKDISLQYTITDTDFDKATYRIDNGVKTAASQSGTIPLSLADGLHKIVIEAIDKKPQTVRDSVSFEMKKATAIEPPATIDSLILYPNPAEDIMHIRYKTNMSKNAYRTIYTLDGKPVERKNIGQITEEDLDITSLKKGMYIMNIVDGTDRQRIKFIKK